MTCFNDHLRMLQEFGAARPFPLNPAYIVTFRGQVANMAGTGWLKPCPAKRGGYLGVSLWVDGVGRTWPVHQIVALTFIGERPSPEHEVAHKNGKRTDNRHRNLAWKTRAENERDKVAHGTNRIRARYTGEKITAAQARYIAEIGRPGRRGIRTQLAKQFNLSITHVSNIISGKRRSNDVQKLHG